VLDVRERDGAVVIGVRVRPRSRPGMELTEGGLVIRVSATPQKGKANEEARRQLAAALDVPPTDVTLRTGAAARRKIFVVSGVSAVEARSRLLAVAR
jgi:uncharacterized protein